MVNRKEQIERDFLRHLKRRLTRVGCPLNEAGLRAAKEALRDAAMVGACAERDRTLEILKRHHGGQAHLVAGEVIAKGVLKVIGYEDV